MIGIFDKFVTDFSGNGIGALCSSSCEVSETLNGEYELTMVHPPDESDKWQRIIRKKGRRGQVFADAQGYHRVCECICRGDDRCGRVTRYSAEDGKLFAYSYFRDIVGRYGVENEKFCGNRLFCRDLRIS